MLVAVCFTVTGLDFSVASAQEDPLLLGGQRGISLPAPGVMVHLSPPFDPPILKGIKVQPDNPLRFDFILDQATQRQTPDALKQETIKLIKYFLASLTIPEKDLWVNLSPYEKDRIIPQSFGLTEMGRDLLAEDYMLKQITASLIYPEGEIGKKFWKRIYEIAVKKFGTTNIPVNTFNKVWIVPEKAVVYENAKAGTAYVVESKLKVMLEQDYLSLEKNSSSRLPSDVGLTTKATQVINSSTNENINALGSQIIREVVIPELNKEVNENKNFSQLRQVYNSLILATWYKKKIKDSILAQVYEDKKKIAGVGYDKSIILVSPTRGHVLKGAVSPSIPNDAESIYQLYIQAYKKGVYNYIKDESDPITQERIPRKYFSGGIEFGFGEKNTDLAMSLQIIPKATAFARDFLKGRIERENDERIISVQIKPTIEEEPTDSSTHAPVKTEILPIVRLVGAGAVRDAISFDFHGKPMSRLLGKLNAFLKGKQRTLQEPNVLLIGGTWEDVYLTYKSFPQATIIVVNLDEDYLNEIRKKYKNTLECKQSRLFLFLADAQELSRYKLDAKERFQANSFDVIAAPGVDESAFYRNGPLNIKQIIEQQLFLVKEGGYILIELSDLRGPISEAIRNVELETIRDNSRSPPSIFRKIPKPAKPQFQSGDEAMAGAQARGPVADAAQYVEGITPDQIRTIQELRDELKKNGLNSFQQAEPIDSPANKDKKIPVYQYHGLKIIKKDIIKESKYGNGDIEALKELAAANRPSIVPIFFSDHDQEHFYELDLRDWGYETLSRAIGLSAITEQLRQRVTSAVQEGLRYDPMSRFWFQHGHLHNLNILVKPSGNKLDVKIIDFKYLHKIDLETNPILKDIHDNQGKFPKMQTVSLEGKAITDFQFEWMDLRGWDFSGADLEERFFFGSDLRGAKFVNSNLKRARFSHSDIRRVNFEGADLQNTYLKWLDMSGVNLKGANMRGKPVESSLNGSLHLNHARNLRRAHFWFPVTKRMSNADILERIGWKAPSEAKPNPAMLTSDRAMTAGNGDQSMNVNFTIERNSERENTGGIDLRSANKYLQTQNKGGEIRFHMDSAMLHQLQTAKGFEPEIIDVQPMTNLPKFLGIQDGNV